MVEPKWVVWAAAQNVYAPAALLGLVWRHPDIHLRSVVAHHPNTPGWVLEKLSQDVLNVRLFVAFNPNTPAEVLEKLSVDKRHRVRSRVARNPSTPQEIRTKLHQDSNSYVRFCANMLTSAGE